MNLNRKWRDAIVGYLFLLPNITGFMLFLFFPVLASFLLTFTEWDLISDPSFAGLGNYTDLLGFSNGQAGLLQANDPDFWYYLYNTLFFMLAIPFGMFCSLMMAMALNRKWKGIGFFRTVYFLPSMCMPVAVFLLWQWVYNPEYGIINSLLNLVGIKGPRWLADPAWSKPALMLTGLWIAVGGYNMILYLAGLQNIPRDYYEAAAIDGASKWAVFWHITWPLLSSTTFFILIISIIGGFQGGFEQAYIMTGGGPEGSTTTLMFYIYNNAFQWFKMGYAASIAWVLFILVFAVTLVSWHFGGRRVHYY